MSRPLRITLALIALLLTLAGAAGRLKAALDLEAAFRALAGLKAATLSDASARFAPIRTLEIVAESLLALGLALWALLGARLARASVGLTVAAFVTVLGAGVVSASLPATRLPEMAFLRQPSQDWPYGIVRLDRAYWNAFIVRTSKNEWAVAFERSELGPEGLRIALERRFALGGAGKRPVRIYLDLTCPADERQVFIDEAHKAADPAGVAVDDEPLPDKADFPVLRRQRYEEELAPFKDTLNLGIFARLVSAAALALAVWWARPQSPRAAAVTGANLLIAFGQAVALPVALYAAMIPDETGAPEWRRLLTHLKPHLWTIFASVAAIGAGSLVAAIGNFLLPPPEPETPRRPLQRPKPAPPGDDAWPPEVGPPGSQTPPLQ